MEQSVNEDVEAIVARDTWTWQDQVELTKQLCATGNAPAMFRSILAGLEAQTPEAKGSAGLKIGIARYTLCQFAPALEALSTATDNKDRHYVQALCYGALRQYDRAAEEFARAEDRGWEPVEIQLAIAEMTALGGDVDVADKAVSKLEKKLGETAEWLYVRGLIDEISGRGDQAVQAYQKARSIDPSCSKATFRLAYYCDLHGDEQYAIELYAECTSHPPIHANALLNMAVLYEDAGLYDRAIVCLKRILATNPAHGRARLFLKDVEASKTMYYDEDRAKRIAKRNAVLDIPVTDFELSVRARNCLKKMNIRTLGDLVNITEAELLSYKNFGETSLKEIKDILVVKDLHLGQALEESGDLATESDPAPKVEVRDEGVLATPIDQVEFSVRARRALQALRLMTLGDLVSKSEAELMSCRNFGQTSLNEIRQRLTEFGLELRDSN